MRAYLIAAPVWVQAVIQGIFFGTVMTVLPLGSGGSWPGRLVGGVIAGVGFGVGMGLLARRDPTGARSELADLQPEQRRAAARAAARGPAPSDPVVRAAALRYAERSRAFVERRWRLDTIFLVVMVVVFTVLALTTSPWWWLGVTVVAAGGAYHLRSRRHLDHRIDVLAT